MSRIVAKPIVGQGNVFTKALIFHDRKSISKTEVWDKSQPIYVYFQDGTTLSRKWTAADKTGFMEAVKTWSEVTNLKFAITTNKALADLIESKVGSKELGAGTIGLHGNPNDAKYGAHDGDLLVGSGGQAYGYFNVQNAEWGAIKKGSVSYNSVIHEVGHALGLAHPHDTFDRSGLFPGVKNGQERVLGTQNLNHNVFTIMSYNGGYGFDKFGLIKLNPADTPVDGADYSVSSPGPFDIAAIQLLYGTRSSHTGNNNYKLGDKSGAWTTILDTGGSADSISYAGNKNAHIDLRPASLKVETIGGGGLSYVSKVYNGYTIAANVWIENATGGNGKDGIQGNIKNNILSGGGGDDSIAGDKGNDTINGGLGVDHLYGEADNDTITGGGGEDTIYGGLGNDKLTTSKGLVLFSNPDLNSLGKAYVSGAEGNDAIYLNDAKCNVLGGTGVDTVYTSVDFLRAGQAGSIEKIVGVGSANIRINLIGRDLAGDVTGNAGNNTIWGGFGNDTLRGGVGSDTLDGSRGSDRLTGGDGNDTLKAEGFVGDLDVDYYLASKGTDTILDFALQVDHLYIDGGTVSKDGNKHVVVTHGIGTFVLSSVTWSDVALDPDMVVNDIILSDANFKTSDITLKDTAVPDLGIFL